MSDTVTRADFGPSSSLSVVFLSLCALVAPFLAYYSFGSDMAAIRGMGLLLVPSCFGAWIFCSIRGLHERELRLFSMSSTYVSIIFTIVSLLLLYFGVLSLEKAKNTANQDLAMTLFAAGGIVFAASLAWSFWYNLRSTGSAALTVSVTLLQVVTTTVIVLGLVWWIINRKHNNS